MNVLLDMLSLFACVFAVTFGTMKVYAQDGHTDITLSLSKVQDADTLHGDVVMSPTTFIDDVDDPPGGSADGTFSYGWEVSVVGYAFYPPTVILKNQRIRVANCDAYELNTNRGKSAKLAVEKLIAGKTIKLTPRGKDSFGRLLAIVTLIDKDGGEVVLADWLIKNRHGIVYKDKR